MVLAIVADALQIVVFPLFIEGALSPADDMLDIWFPSGRVRQRFLTVLWKRASLKNPRRDSPQPVTGVMAHLGITVDGTRAQTYIQAQGVA
jgi:hypothetical protein